MRKPVFRDLRPGYGENWISHGIYHTDFLTAKNRFGCTCWSLHSRVLAINSRDLTFSHRWVVFIIFFI